MIKYTPKLIAFLQRHWNTDVGGERLAQLIGVSYDALRSAVSRLRAKGHVFETNTVPIGHTHTCSRSDGSTFQKIKTAEGFKYVPQRVQRAIANPPMPRAASNPEDLLTIEVTELPPLKKRERKKQVRKLKKQVAPANPTATVEIGRNRAAGVVKTDARRPTKHTRSRDPFNNDVNPATVKVKQEVGGQWVQKDNRSWVYRKNMVVQ